MSAKLTPESKLFLSCDLVGSTHFKQTSDGWQKIFLSFYWEFPQFLSRVERQFRKDSDLETIFTLWKAVGDELIFEVPIRTEEDVSRAVRIWLYTLDLFEKESLAESAGSLALKGGAFIATFPGPDSRSTIPIDIQPSDSGDSTGGSNMAVIDLNDEALNENDRTKYLYDYFGPSIDTGFRVYGLASKRFFTMSLEVAWSMAAACQMQSINNGLPRNNLAPYDSLKSAEFHSVEDFKYLGEHELKGVWKGRAYPVFAIDRDHADGVNVSLHPLNSRSFGATDISNLGNACYRDPNYKFRVYLPDAKSQNDAFTTEPIDAMQGLRETAPSMVGAETMPPDDDQGDMDELPPNLPKV